MNKNIQINKLSLNLATSLLAIVLIVVILFFTQTIVLPILFSIILAVMVYPIAKLLENLKFNRTFSTIFSLLLAILLFTGISYLIIMQVIDISKDAAAIIDKLQVLSNDTLKWITKTFQISQNELADKALKELEQGLSTISKYAMTFFSSFGSVLTSGILVPIFAFFFLYYRDFFKSFFIKAFKSTPQEKVEDTLKKMYDALQNYMLGQLTVMAIVAILNTIGLYLIGLEYAWFFGVLASLLMILPYVGIAIGSIFPAIFALATMDSPYYALGIVGWFQVVQFLEGNFITPNIVGGKVSLNPMVSMLAIILGGMLFGFAGFILALPIAALLKVVFDSIPQLESFGYLLGDPEIENKKMKEQEQELENNIEVLPETTDDSVLEDESSKEE
ncbi:AI-2E family transporter [Faecalibacter macacae]|uniref:AI-2E family transporter n=1 Tax=Faecalibacter macacae TaxID=1859289 RepID=A0A3L9M9B5_9FLAO|nr:AI-2E family transporter [Faecalibacter macacae]RLZ09123.1 AI-2E family transporter [Faecalibacter macacae]